MPGTPHSIIITCVKKFFSVKLKQYKHNIPVGLAKDLLVSESKLIQYLKDNNALAFKIGKKTGTLNLYAEDQYLMIGKLLHPNIFRDNGRMGFMELYITHIINKKMPKPKKRMQAK